MKYSADQLRRLLDFNQDTGLLSWKEREGQNRFNSIYQGRVAGSIDSHGYVQVSIGNRRHLAHRLAWMIVYGTWPAGQIDHVNGARSDNRIENLRLVTAAVNSQNLRRARSDNAVGLLGVSPHRNTGKYIAKITTAGRTTYLGIFDTADAAHSAYLKAKRNLHEGCTL